MTARAKLIVAIGVRSNHPQYAVVAEIIDQVEVEARAAGRAEGKKEAQGEIERLRAAMDPEMLFTFANEIKDFANSARMESLRVIARREMEALSKEKNDSERTNRRNIRGQLA